MPGAGVQLGKAAASRPGHGQTPEPDRVYHGKYPMREGYPLSDIL